MPTPTMPGGHGLPPASTIDSSTNFLIPTTPSAGTHILRKLMFSEPEPFGHALDVEPVPVGDELPVHDRQPVPDVRAGVLAGQHVHRVRPQRMLDRRARRARLQAPRRCGPGGAGSARRRGRCRRRSRCPGRRGSSARRRSRRCDGSSRGSGSPSSRSRGRAPPRARRGGPAGCPSAPRRTDAPRHPRRLRRGRWWSIVLMRSLSPRLPVRRDVRRRRTRAASCPSCGCARGCRPRSRRRRTGPRAWSRPCSSITRPPFW